MTLAPASLRGEPDARQRYSVWNLWWAKWNYRSRGSYGLDDRAIEVRSPAKAKNFSSTHSVQTGSGVQPAYFTMDIVGGGGPFPGAKVRPGRETDHSSPSSAEIENQ
jgi:hypothetical protein